MLKGCGKEVFRKEGRFQILYSKSELFSELICGYAMAIKLGCIPIAGKLYHTHEFLGWLEAKDLEEAFTMMQGENWSPDGEARSFIESSGTGHTSMSVGDIIFDTNDQAYWFCDIAGWKQLVDPLA